MSTVRIPTEKRLDAAVYLLFSQQGYTEVRDVAARIRHTFPTVTPDMVDQSLSRIIARLEAGERP